MNLDKHNLSSWALAHQQMVSFFLLIVIATLPGFYRTVAG